MKFRLLAMIITLAAVTATTTNAQRRSTSDSKNEKRVESTRTGNKSNIERKSANHDDLKESRATSTSVKRISEVKRNANSGNGAKHNKVSQKNDYTKQHNGRSNGQNYPNNSAQTTNENRKRVTNKPDQRKGKVNSTSDNTRRSTGYSVDDNRNNYKQNSERKSNVIRSKTERYNLNTNDVRYRPTRDYKGKDKYWTSDFRNENRNLYNHGHKFNYNKYNHWDHMWEGYRWNHNSWVNYYSFYNPYSYRNNKYYYHHNYYGHVMRKFEYRPQIYIHNNVKYYCYDGNFFRYHKGVGYVLVDMPFGMTFNYLPKDYEKVYINGYLYYRVGNVFFEHTNYGFQLVHYPERYFSYNDGYHNEGFRFNDMDF